MNCCGLYWKALSSCSYAVIKKMEWIGCIVFGFLLAAGNLDGEDPIFLLCTSVWEVQIIFLFKAIFTLPAQSCGRSVRSTDVVLQEPLVLCIFPCPLLPPVCQCWNWCGSSCCSVLCGWLVAFPAVTPSAIQAGLLFTSLPPPPTPSFLLPLLVWKSSCSLAALFCSTLAFSCLDPSIPWQKKAGVSTVEF